MKKVLVLEDNPIMLSHLRDIIRWTDTKNKVCRPNDAAGLSFVENIRKIKQYSFVPAIFITSFDIGIMYKKYIKEWFT